MNRSILPEAVARTYPVFDRIYAKTVSANQRMIRVKQRWQHKAESLMEIRGITPGSERANLIPRLMNIVRKDALIDLGGDTRPTSTADLRKLLSDFAETGSSRAHKVLSSETTANLNVNDLPYYQQEAREILKLSNRDIDFARELQKSMEFSWRLNREIVRKAAEAQGLTGDAVTKVVNDTTGKELDGYISHIRATLKSVSTDLETSDINPDIRGMFTHELKAIDALYGSTSLEDGFFQEAQHLANLWKAFQASGQKPAATRFSFTNPEDNLGLAAREYDATKEGFSQAIRDLFDIRGSQQGDPSGLMAAAVKSLDDIARRPGNLVAMMAHVPTELRVRFYERRQTTARPWRADITEIFPAYMNATLKFAHIQPILNDVVAAVEEAGRTNPEIVPAMVHFVNDLIGNPHRASRVALNEMNKVLSLSYGATLLMNLSSTFSNYFGQVGFIYAENGLVPTITAIKAMGASVRNRTPMIDFLGTEMIGLESQPFGTVTRNLDETFTEMRAAESVGEVLRIAKQAGLSAADIFRRSEQQIRRVSYLAGVVKNMTESPDPALRWSHGLGSEELMTRFTRTLNSPGGRDVLAAAGETSESRTAFLFGNANTPEVIRWLRSSDPTGLGASATMFTNYPVQATARLSMWIHDASRLRPTWAAGGHGLRDVQGRAALGKLTRFFTYGTLIAGPFFLAPILRDMVIAGDRENATDLKNFFVEWEKKYSFAGLVGQAIKASTGEYNTLDLAGKITIGPSAGDPFGPIGTLGGGPLVQAGVAAIPAIHGTLKDLIPGGGSANIDQIRAREKFIGGRFENLISGLGNPQKVIPDVPASTIIPAGVAAARLAAMLVVQFQGGSFDAQGRLVQPLNETREIIRQFGRPLDEVLASTESRAAMAGDEAHDLRVERVKKAITEGNTAAIGDALVADPMIMESIEPADIERLFRDRNLAPSARAVSHLTRGAARRQLMRSARMLSEGRLTPAEEFEEKQKLAILTLRFMREDPTMRTRLRKIREASTARR